MFNIAVSYIMNVAMLEDSIIFRIFAWIFWGALNLSLLFIIGIVIYAYIRKAMGKDKGGVDPWVWIDNIV